MQMTRMLSLGALFGAVMAVSRRSLCLTAPTIDLQAGESQLSAMIDMPLQGHCEATMQFYDASFLPIHFSFEDLTCDGKQVNTFQVPKGAANGEVDVIWQCAGLPQTCTHAMVSGGSADSALDRLRDGKAGCILESLHTKVTLLTLTRSTTPVVTTVPTVVTVTSTSFSTPSSMETSDEGPMTTETGRTPATSVETAKTTHDTAAFRENRITLDAAESTPTLTGVDHTTTSDPVFANDASRTTTGSLLPAVTVTLVSTFTIMQTAGADCTSH